MCPDETSDFSSQIRNELAVFKMARRIASSMLTRDDLSHCFLGDAVVRAERPGEYVFAVHSIAPFCIEQSMCVSESTSPSTQALPSSTPVHEVSQADALALFGVQTMLKLTQSVHRSQSACSISHPCAMTQRNRQRTSCQ